MKKALTLLVLAVLLFSCKSGSETREMEPREYKVKIGKKDTIYMTFDKWNIFMKKKEYPKNILPILEQLEQNGVIVPLFGLSKDYSSGARVMVEPTNVELKQYFKLIKAVNSSNLGEHTEPATININGREAILWDYSAKDNNFKYVEVMFLIGESNLRVSFWTVEELFEEKFPEFMEIINSIR